MNTELVFDFWGGFFFHFFFFFILPLQNREPNPKKLTVTLEMYGGGRLRSGLIRTALPLFGPKFFLVEDFCEDEFVKYELGKEDADDFLLEIDGCFCKFGLWDEESLEFGCCLGFNEEPVELLLDRKCSDRIRLRLLELSQLRLLLRLNCQNDFDCGFSSASKLAERSSLRLFFSEEIEFLEGSGGAIGADSLGLWTNCVFASRDFLIWTGRILPLEKSSSAEERSWIRRLPMQKSKSDSSRVKSRRSRLPSDEGNKSVWFRSCEKEILGLIPTLEISEQTSIAITTNFSNSAVRENEQTNERTNKQKVKNNNKPGDWKGREWENEVWIEFGEQGGQNLQLFFFFLQLFGDWGNGDFEDRRWENEMGFKNEEIRELGGRKIGERETKVLKLSTERLQKEKS